MVLRPCSVDVVREMQGERLMFSSCFIRRMLFWNTLRGNNDEDARFPPAKAQSSTHKRVVKKMPPRTRTAMSM